jgi:hypothetical protein
MFKKKATLVILMAAMIISASPLAVQLTADIWTCADLSHLCWRTTSMGCAGDVMYYSGCRLYCQTGSTTSPVVSCYDSIDSSHIALSVAD